jgi:hypothetical protein
MTPSRPSTGALWGTSSTATRRPASLNRSKNDVPWISTGSVLRVS